MIPLRPPDDPPPAGLLPPAPLSCACASPAFAAFFVDALATFVALGLTAFFVVFFFAPDFLETVPTFFVPTFFVEAFFAEAFFAEAFFAGVFFFAAAFDVFLADAFFFETLEDALLVDPALFEVDRLEPPPFEVDFLATFFEVVVFFFAVFFATFRVLAFLVLARPEDARFLDRPAEPPVLVVFFRVVDFFATQTPLTGCSTMQRPNKPP